MAKVRFPKDNIVVDAPVGKKLKDIAEENGANIHFACGGNGTCGTCLIKVIKGIENLNEKTKIEKRTLELLGAEPDNRLACQCTIVKDGEIVIENVY
ncbi:MAG: 2Fe-2S iron-sulfur cluster-binding protein [Candidatus Micrarchaeia archaeon]